MSAEEALSKVAYISVKNASQGLILISEELDYL